MTDKTKNIIEALLFASDTPLPIQKMKEILELNSSKDIRKGLDQLGKHYEKTDSSLRIIEVAGGFQLVSKEDYATYVQKLYKGRQASRLTQRALETLAIIAYKQPITKHEMESIRGVNVDGVVKTLLERNLVSIEGRQKAPGNPLLYGTTKYFLEYFGLKTLEALPKLKEIDELLKEDDKFLESLDQVALKQLEPEALGLTSLEDANEGDANSSSDNLEKANNTNQGEIDLEIEPTEDTDQPQNDTSTVDSEEKDDPGQSRQSDSEDNSETAEEVPQPDQDESVKEPYPIRSNSTTLYPNCSNIRLICLFLPSLRITSTKLQLSITLISDNLQGAVFLSSRMIPRSK